MKILQTSVVAGAAAAFLITGSLAANAAAYPKYKAPKVFGTSFQADPHHDFTKHISPRHNGILRGWITHVSGTAAEYAPIRWHKGTMDEGYFEAPKEGDVMAYRSAVAKDVVYLSAFGCKTQPGQMTVNRNNGLGSAKCSRAVLLKRAKASRMPSLITVYRGRIVKVQEIYTP